jgi:hypothetical protein
MVMPQYYYMIINRLSTTYQKESIDIFFGIFRIFSGVPPNFGAGGGFAVSLAGKYNLYVTQT